MRARPRRANLVLKQPLKKNRRAATAEEEEARKTHSAPDLYRDFTSWPRVYKSAAHKSSKSEPLR